MAKKRNSASEKYKKGLRDKKALEAHEASLTRIRCGTFLRTNTQLMIPNTGLCIHKRALWKDGKYLGIVERLILDETMVGQEAIPPGQMAKQMPDSEYEILYKPREEIS